MRALYLFIFILIMSCNNKKETIAGYETSGSGFQYKIMKSATPGDSVKTNNIVKVHLRQFVDDSLMNDTRDQLPVYVAIDSTLRNYDFSEIIPMMRVNDSAICIFPTKDIIKRASGDVHPPEFLEHGKEIKVYFKIISIFTSADAARADYTNETILRDSSDAKKARMGFHQAEMQFDSLIKTLPKDIKKADSGVYVQLLVPGKDVSINKGDSVAIAYKGMLANGKVFETTTRSQPYIIRAAEGFTVTGFDIGIASLGFGDKARIYIPAKHAYGANKAGPDVPAFSNLVFEVEVFRPQK
jgi:FKBP-type peptidyl-prolyl cis-trans isomerase FkpA